MVTLADRVEQETTTTGTGAVNLGSVPDARVGFVASVGNGAAVPYVIEDGDDMNWEVGRGTVTVGSPDTLSRDTVVTSSNGGAKISLTSNTPHKVMLVVDTAFFNTLTSNDRIVATGDGLSGGGDLSQDRTLSWNGVPVKDTGTIVITATGLDFGANLNVTNNNDGTITVDGSSNSPVNSVAGKTGAVTLNKSDVGLSNVTNNEQVAKSGDTMTGNLNMDTYDIRFGGTFKMFYNSTNNSIDIEVI